MKLAALVAVASGKSATFLDWLHHAENSGKFYYQFCFILPIPGHFFSRYTILWWLYGLNLVIKLFKVEASVENLIHSDFGEIISKVNDADNLNWTAGKNFGSQYKPEHLMGLCGTIMGQNTLPVKSQAWLKNCFFGIDFWTMTRWGLIEFY